MFKNDKSLSFSSCNIDDDLLKKENSSIKSMEDFLLKRYKL